MPEPTNLAVHRLRRERDYGLAHGPVTPAAAGFCRSERTFVAGAAGAASLRRRMAKKSRTPPPRRPVQAPQRRGGSTRSADDRRRLYLLLFAASGIVALGIVVAFIAVSGSKSHHS